MRSSIIGLGLAAIIGVVIGLLLQSPKPPVPSSALPAQNDNRETLPPISHENPPSEYAELSQQLQQEIIAREALQQEVAVLSKKLATLSQAETTVDKTGHKKSETANPVRVALSPTKNVWFNQQALIDAGMEQSEAEQLKIRFEEMELAKLYLRDQAIREGWSGSKRYREERQRLESKTEGIRQELGDETYDAYLFAAGQPNRVSVQSVLSGSSAGNAGMLSGDQVIRYNGQRIYNWRDLRNATTQGELSETVSTEILRDGRLLEIYVQRGPLGIRMTSTSVAPDF